MLSVNNISFRYTNAVPILQDVSFRVDRGEFLSLVGPNGSGKTTLLRLLDRIYIPQSGNISLDEKNLSEYTRPELARRIAFVPQDSTPLFPFTVLEVVLMGRSPHSRGKLFESERDRQIANEMLSITDTKHLANQPVTTLSGGERQRVLIARALAQQPEMLFLDEPNAHLDIAHQLEIFSILKKLNAETGLTIISVSHDLNLAAAYSHRVGVLVCGSLLAMGAPKDVMTSETIASAFRTKVLVDEHPLTNSPRVTLII